MPFEKGNKLGGRTTGSKNKKSAEWEALRESIIGKNAKKFNEELNKLDGQTFIDNYTKILEWFKPKLQRTEQISRDFTDLDIDLTGLSEAELSALEAITNRVKPTKE